VGIKRIGAPKLFACARRKKVRQKRAEADLHTSERLDKRKGKDQQDGAGGVAQGGGQEREE
jgi:hypothetical protein